MEAQKFSKKEAIRFGWETMKRNFWFFAGIVAFLFIISYLPTIVAKGLDEVVLPTIATVFFFVANIVFWVVQLIVSIGIIYIALEFASGARAVFSDLFSKANLLVDYIISSVVYSVVVTIGLVLLVVPGIILAARLQFYQYLIVGKGAGPIQALKISWRMTRGQVVNLILLWLILLAINIAGTLAFGIGLLATIPTTMVAMAYVYKKLES